MTTMMVPNLTYQGVARLIKGSRDDRIQKKGHDGCSNFALTLTLTPQASKSQQNKINPLSRPARLVDSLAEDGSDYFLII